MTEPGPHPARDTAGWFVDYLDWLRGEVVEAVLGLSPQEQRTTRLASGWTPIELLSHVLHMEQRWFVWGFLGEAVADPWGDWGEDETWHVPDDVSAQDLAGRLEAVAARTREVLAGHELSEVAPPGPRFEGEPPTLEWICFHVLTEYARHAGHLDIAVELGQG